MMTPGSIKASARIAPQSTMAISAGRSAAKDRIAGIGTNPARFAQSLRRNAEDSDHEVVRNQGNEHRERKDQGVFVIASVQEDQSGEGHAEGALQRHADQGGDGGSQGQSHRRR